MLYSIINYWVWFLLIGALIGLLLWLVTSGRGFGIIGDIVLGIVGAMLGGWLAGALGLGRLRMLGISANSSIMAVMLALFGAVVLIGVTRFIIRKVKV